MAYLERVADLVDGFEASYGMDFLTSPHWLAIHEGEVSDAESAVTAMAFWNDHKRRSFKPERILLTCVFIINE